MPATLPNLGPIAIACGTLVLAISPALGQWTVVNLQPSAPYTESYAQAVTMTHEVGYVRFGTTYHAVHWSGAAASIVDLHPPGAYRSSASAAHGRVQAGSVEMGPPGAALWNEAADSWVNLHPSVSPWSYITGMSDDQQVGGTVVLGLHHASLWSGSASSWVDLTPPGTAPAVAYGVSYGQQVGVAFLDIYEHAVLWRGTAASHVDLHPRASGAVASRAFGIHGGEQVGELNFQFGGEHAALWRGSVDSFVDLHPPGATSSTAQAVFAGRQVGYVGIGNDFHAAIWNGTAASWEDLSLVLPGTWPRSYANGIVSNGTTIRVVGYGYNPVSARFEALLWSRSLCVADMDNGTFSGRPDGGVTIDDLLYYFNQYALGFARADIDDGSGTGTPDGGVTIDDLLYYLFRFEAGC